MGEEDEEKEEVKGRGLTDWILAASPSLAQLAHLAGNRLIPERNIAHLFSCKPSMDLNSHSGSHTLSTEIEVAIRATYA